METRVEKDSFGPIEVPSGAMWGAQTQRSINNFKIGPAMPMELIRAMVLVKKACAKVNCEFGLDPEVAEAIQKAADEVLNGQIGSDQFPLVVFQTGSGTQTNMNVNEVLAFRARQILNGKAVHPNDDVNRSASSNDTFPTAMHVAAVLATRKKLLPALNHLAEVLAKKSEAFAKVVKVGRTHAQDATPVSLGQEFSGYRASVLAGAARIDSALAGVRLLAQGGTAVGTGLNAPAGFDARVCTELTRLTEEEFLPAGNKFEALATNDALTFFHGGLSGLASALHKIANDIRLLGSGPRAGLGELNLPENEPGSSIMPGKVNPTQCEALTMVAAKVIGNQSTLLFCNSMGQFELNVYRPVLAQCLLESIELLSQAVESFAEHCLEGIQPNFENIAKHLESSLMLVTALNPHIGYDNAAKIAKHAHKNNLSLKQAALELKLVSEEDFDKWVRPEDMLAPK